MDHVINFTFDIYENAYRNADSIPATQDYSRIHHWTELF